MNSEDSERIGLSVPKDYSTAMDAWFWTCPRCGQKIQHEMSIGLTEFNIKGERVCKPCFVAYDISSIPRLYKQLLALRKEAQEIELNHEPICSDECLAFDEKSDDYVKDALEYLNLVANELVVLKRIIEKAKGSI